MRVLACVDPVPAPDGSCAAQAWVEQAGIAEMLPSFSEANEVGFAFLSSLVIIAAVKRFLKPQRQIQ